MTNEPHREWVYRMSFELGRHIIGYEVQKVQAAVDWFTSENQSARLPIGVMGYGEGGLIAFYAAALDPRIDATVVSGYFQQRENVWQEPIYRDVWGLLREFGDAEVASMIAPRALIVEACRGPQVDGPPPATPGRRNVACPNGKLTTPPLDSVQREAHRTRPIYAALGAGEHFQLVVSGDGTGLPGSEDALKALVRSLGAGNSLRPLKETPQSARPAIDPPLRMKDQIAQMIAFTYGLGQKSPKRRAEFWSKADASSSQAWQESTKPLRDSIWEEIFGKISDPPLPFHPRTRLIYDAPRFRGYEVMLDVWPDVFAYGILLVPRDIAVGERRPVVVCQHGFQGRAREVADPNIDSPYYHHYGASLADLGFVVYAPQNPFIGYDHFRLPQRVGHPLKLGLYALILGQHQQTIDWLAEQPFVDRKRIGFYGVSYGGETAVRVPPLLESYALTITAANFGAIVPRMTSVTENGFMFDDSYDMYQFNLANVADYSDLAKLMLPRPFMVERAHGDGSSTDEVVAYEFAAVKHFYNQLGMADRAAIEYFNGGHTVHGIGTFEFLLKFLYPERMDLAKTLKPLS
jgi:dienelactone hydrolase